MTVFCAWIRIRAHIPNTSGSGPMLVRWIRSRTCILYVAVEPAVGPLILNANPDPNANADPDWNFKCRSVKKYRLRIRTDIRYIPNTDPDPEGNDAKAYTWIATSNLLSNVICSF
jgi:hypothetical protein